MKNLFKTLLALSLACMMLVSLVSCGDKSSAVKKAFEAKDYTVTTASTNDEGVQTLLKILLNEEQIKKVNEYELILCTPKGLLNITNNALVIKFASADDARSFLGEDSYKKAKDDGIVNGNCLILTMGSEAKAIFKEA